MKIIWFILQYFLNIFQHLWLKLLLHRASCVNRKYSIKKKKSINRCKLIISIRLSAWHCFNVLQLGKKWWKKWFLEAYDDEKLWSSLEKLIVSPQMSVDGNGEKGAISCVNWAKIITVYRKYLHSTKKLYASLRTIMDFSYSYVEIWFNECMYGIVA